MSTPAAVCQRPSDIKRETPSAQAATWEEATAVTGWPDATRTTVWTVASARRGGDYHRADG